MASSYSPMVTTYGEDKDSADSESAESGDSQTDLHLFEAGDVRIPMAPSSYDGIVLALACLLDQKFVKAHGFKVGLLQFLFALILHIVTVGFILAIVFLMLTTAVQRKAEPYREDIQNKTLTIRHALEQEVRVDIHDEALLQCTNDKTYPGVHFFILIIWGAKMIGEVEDAVWRLVLVCRLKRSEDPSEELMSENPEDSHIVLFRTTLTLRIVQVLLVVFPQMTIAFFLWFTGAKYLFFATSMGTLILKAIGLSFISALDKLLYAAFASMHFRARLARTTFMFRQERPSWHWSMWGNSLVKVIGVLASSAYFTLWKYPDVTEMRGQCRAYHALYPDLLPGYSDYDLWTTFLRAMEWQ